MQQPTITLTEAQLTALSEVAAERGASISARVREAVDAWLAREGDGVADREEWGRRLDLLLQRRRRIAETLELDEADVERDVERAVREVRERPARRR
jgi:hypothetical protein